MTPPLVTSAKESVDHIMVGSIAAIRANLKTAGCSADVLLCGQRIVYVHPRHGGSLTARYGSEGAWHSTFHDTDHRERCWIRTAYMIKTVTARILELDAIQKAHENRAAQLERICGIMDRLVGVHRWDRMGGARYSLGVFDLMAAVTHDCIQVRSARIGISVDIAVSPSDFDAVIEARVRRAIGTGQVVDASIVRAQQELDKLK